MIIMAFEIKIIFLFIFSNVFVHMNFNQIIPVVGKETFYSYKTQGCLPREEHLFNSTEENRGRCFTRCHYVDGCVSVAFNTRTNGCRGYGECPHSCSSDVTQKDWVSFCEYGKNLKYIYIVMKRLRIKVYIVL